MSITAEPQDPASSFPGKEAQYPQMFSDSLSLGADQSAFHSRYLPREQCYTIGSECEDPGAGFIYRKLEGDFILRAHLGRGTGPDPEGRLGLMLRDSLTRAGTSVTAAIDSRGQLRVESRTASSGRQEERVAADPPPTVTADVVQLERRGRRLIVSYARLGELFSHTELDQNPLPDRVYVGLFARTDEAGALEGRFHNVRLVLPAWEGLVPYEDFLGSRLELLDPDSGERQVIYSTPEGIEAPNWTPDGKALIYNSGGRLYRFDLARGTPEAIDTDFAVRNNNDHVLSFDGKQMGISHHSEEHGGDSIVYRLPAGGGEPRPITDRGPSYLHSWSPDGRYVIYTGGRDGHYNIYRRASDGSGEELALTQEPTLDDGSEYSPDGKHIYFNSARTGTMELWRMDADGGNPRQLTDDALNNWFPHVSPDGKRLVFLSYRSDIDANDHPYYQHVYLRTMPVEGGEPRVIAYLYGGQGTINVPSWSPDGRRVAFVSHTQLTLRE